MSISSAFKSFWHSMTSNDRHSEYNSPYRTGQHMPLSSENRRMSALAAVATASDSRADISSPYYTDEGALHSAGFDGALSPALSQRPLRSPGMPLSPAPYSPGARSESARRGQRNHDGFEVSTPNGEIPMQAFQDGLPPPPPVTRSWERIDGWAEENFPELFDNLCEGCTTNDLNETEHMLDCSLPMDVRDSLQVHDGQERGGLPTGIIFGCMLLDCEEIVQEWDNWRKVNSEYLQQSAAAAAEAAAAAKAMNAEAGNGSVDGEGSDEASSSKAPSTTAAPGRPMWRQELQSLQDCVPANAVQKVYAHPAWIPLVRDWGGNNLAIDLAPGPTGTWGQVILFGRDYDTKYVVARSWSAFIAIVADDLNSGKWFIEEDTNELKLREFKSSRVEPGYFDILRWRADQKYGRRQPNPKRKSMAPSVVASPTGTGSPYISPTEPPTEPRGRPLQRLSSPSPLGSPSRPGFGKSPLARVTEEASLPSSSAASPNGKAAEKLVEVETPRVSSEASRPSEPAVAAAVPAAVAAAPAAAAPATAPAATPAAAVAAVATSPVSGSPKATTISRKSTLTNGTLQAAVEDETMKTIEI